MCITSSRSILDNTYRGASDINHPTYECRHVLAYQNRVQNTAQGSNCMLLHVPSAEPMQPDFLVATSAQPDFLMDLYKSYPSRIGR